MSAVLESVRTPIEIVPFSDRYAEDVIAIARQMQAESVLHSRMSVDPAKLLSRLAAIAQSEYGYFKLALLNGLAVGAFIGLIDDVYWGSDLVARDLGWFVVKTARSSGAAGALLADFESWARGRGARFVMLGQTTGTDIARLTAIYQRFGYGAVGVNAVKEI